MAQYIKSTRQDVRAFYLSPHIIQNAHKLLEAYRAKVEATNRGPYFGGNTPSSGLVAVFAMLSLCRNVTAYGFGMDAETNGASQEYHYFHLYSPAHSKKKNSMNRVHSFDAERDLIHALSNEGIMTYCPFIPHNKKHNSRCGLRSAEDQVNQDPDDFSEIDSINMPRTKRLRKEKVEKVVPDGVLKSTLENWDEE
eukprot:gene29383-36593_t